MKRVFVIVLDSFGVGAAPDAADFGDCGANTLASVASSPLFNAPNLAKLGLFNIDGVDCGRPEPSPDAAYGRMRELSAGKDTTIGHWELAGIVSPSRLLTFPNGFPDAVLNAFRAATGRDILCNKPYSGTKVIEDYGNKHLNTGALIVYTSADSVFQIAAHEDVVPIETLYSYCRSARSILCGDYAVGRVIARPFAGRPGSFYRTASRRDFSLEPSARTMLDAIKDSGRQVIAVGKITDIFAGRGITDSILTHGNAEGMSACAEVAKRDFTGLCFVNLVDFDMLYGHRNDADGYARAISEFDSFLPTLSDMLNGDDMLMITADHGCDPGDVSTDHTREFVPLLVCGKGIKHIRLGTRNGFSDLAATVCEALGVDFGCPGKSFFAEVKK